MIALNGAIMAVLLFIRMVDLEMMSVILMAKEELLMNKLLIHLILV